MSIIELVALLTQAEKRHFTLYVTGQTRKPKYVELFDFISKSQKIENKDILNAGFSANDKNFLKEKIEHALHDLYLTKSVNSELKFHTESMERYFNNQQWDKLENCINRTKRIAQQNERYLDWLQAIYWEKEMLEAQPESRLLFEKLELIIKEEEEVQQYLSIEMKYYNLRASLRALLLKDIRLANKENKEKFNRLISSELIHSNVEPVSLKSKFIYYQLKATAAKYKGNKEEAFNMAKKMITIFDNNPNLKNQCSDWYKKCLCFLCDICHFSNKIEDIPSLIDLIGNEEQYFKTVCLYGIRYSIHKTDKEGGFNYLNSTKVIFEKENHQIRAGRQLSIFYNASVFCSFFSNWKEMNYWIEKILHFQRTDDRRDLQFGARILYLINHFELDSYDIDNHINAVTKYFTRNIQYTESNQYILQAFRYLYRALNHKEMIPIWTDLRDYLNPIVNNVKGSTQQLGLGELSIWCTSKIENISMAEVYKNS